MKKIFCIFLFVFLVNSAFSHDYWMLFNSSKKKVVIGAGHKFPKSSFLLKRSLICRVNVKIPGRSFVKLQIKKMGMSWGAILPSLSSGVYVGRYELKKEYDNEAMFYAKFIYLQRPVNVKKNFYIIGDGLEVVPDLGIRKSNSKRGLTFFLLFNGKKVSGQLNIIEEDGRSYYRYLSVKNGCVLQIKKGQRYLILSKYKGKSCSLTLSL